MKNINKIGYISAVAFVALAFAPATFAAELGGKLEVQPVMMNDDAGAEVHTDVGGEVNVAPIKGVRMEDGVNTAGGVRTNDDKMNANAQDAERATGTVRAQEVANDNAERGLENAVLHIELNGRTNDEDANNASAPDNASQVRSENDFKSFVQTRSQNDERIRAVDVNEGKVEVDYAEDAKLFGFLKTTVTARATADTEGNVTVKYPWYHIFMKKENSSATLQSNIARAIDAERKAEKEGVASTTVRADITTAMGIPNLFELIVNTLKGSSASASATANAGTE